jgi:hypothetical protein
LELVAGVALQYPRSDGFQGQFDALALPFVESPAPREFGVDVDLSNPEGAAAEGLPAGVAPHDGRRR